MEITDVVDSRLIAAEKNIKSNLITVKNNYIINKARYNVTSLFEEQEELADIMISIAMGRIQNAEHSAEHPVRCKDNKSSDF